MSENEPELFTNLERTVHEGYLSRLEHERKMKIPPRMRELVLDAMAQAAKTALDVKKAKPRKKPKPAEYPADDGTPILYWLTVSDRSDPVGVSEAVVRKMMDAYKFIDVKAELSAVALDWMQQPDLRPTLNGWKRQLAWWFKHRNDKMNKQKQWMAATRKPIDGQEQKRYSGPNVSETQRQIRLIRSPSEPSQEMKPVGDILKRALGGGDE